MTDYNWKEPEAGGPRLGATERSIARDGTVSIVGIVHATDGGAKASDTAKAGVSI